MQAERYERALEWREGWFLLRCTPQDRGGRDPALVYLVLVRCDVGTKLRCGFVGTTPASCELVEVGVGKFAYLSFSVALRTLLPSVCVSFCTFCSFCLGRIHNIYCKRFLLLHLGKCMKIRGASHQSRISGSQIHPLPIPVRHPNPLHMSAQSFSQQPIVNSITGFGTSL